MGEETEDSIASEEGVHVASINALDNFPLYTNTELIIAETNKTIRQGKVAHHYLSACLARTCLFKAPLWVAL